MYRKFLAASTVIGSTFFAGAAFAQQVSDPAPEIDNGLLLAQEAPEVVQPSGFVSNFARETTQRVLVIPPVGGFVPVTLAGAPAGFVPLIGVAAPFIAAAGATGAVAAAAAAGGGSSTPSTN